jgi:DNA-binding NarL/FixJ family response regulator
MTADELHTWKEHALRVGVAAYLLKPFPLAHLRNVVRCLLGGDRCFPRCSVEDTALRASWECPFLQRTA